MSASKQINLNQLGWQKFDVSATIRKWYAENSGDRLRLIVDCSGCGDRIQVHLFTNLNYNKKHKNHKNFLSKSVEREKEREPEPEPEGRSFDVNQPFLVVFTDPNVMKRVRRRALDCSGALKTQCCKERFYVSFKQLGWDDWIIAPQGYYANYCRGDCGGHHRTPDTFLTYYTHVIEEYRKSEKLNGMQPCCAPLKFSSMSLIYFGPDSKIIKRDLPKMVVDECGCP
jgi:inhibin beta